MITAFSILHVLVAIALVFIVLLQTGRGSEIGAAFGSGASNTLFGSSGTSGFMTRITTVVVVVFMVTSLGLALMHSKAGSSSSVRPRQSVPVERNVPAPAVPAPPAAPAAPSK